MTARNYDNKVDIYALGLVMVEVLCLFKTEHEKEDSFRKMRSSFVELPRSFARDYPNQVTHKKLIQLHLFFFGRLHNVNFTVSLTQNNGHISHPGN